MKARTAIAWACAVALLPGCALQEVRSKSKFGPEFQTKGAGSDRTHNVRWTAQQGVEFKWEQGVDTAVTYRRRDIDNGDGGVDNGVWFEMSLPIWEAPKRANGDHAALVQRIEQLEQRLAELEDQPPQLSGEPLETGDRP